MIIEEAPMIIKEAPKKSREQILQEKANIAEAIRLDTLQKEEEAKQVHLDSLLAQRITEEEELNEQQQKRRPIVVSKQMLGSDLQGKILQRRWLTCLEELRKNLISGKQVESFAPINFEATKASLKRFGEELQTKTSKRLKSDEAKDAEPTKKSGKRRKQMARKGLHTDIDKGDSEDSDEVSEVHCLNLESMDIYMLIERQYPLSAEICKAMLDKKLPKRKAR
ncbi:hypothetical protein Tco_0278119 [Tanacetum coccineum]